MNMNTKRNSSFALRRLAEFLSTMLSNNIVFKGGIYAVAFSCFLACEPIVESNSHNKHKLASNDSEYWYSIGIPVADSCDLLMYTGLEGYDSTGVLDYRFARDYAFAELYASMNTYFGSDIEWYQRFLCEQASGDTTALRLADVPVVVYDYDNKPYYYEFPVIYDGYIEGQVVGTITVAAQPRTTELVEYIFTAPLCYHSSNFSYKRYVGEYPCVYLSEDGGSFYKLSYSMEQHIIELQEVYEPYLISDPYEAMLEKIQELSDEEIADMNLDLGNESYEEQVESIYPNLNAYINSFRLTTATQMHWKSLLQAYSPSSRFYYSSQLLSWINDRINSITRDVKESLEEYDDHRLRCTIWADACGPGIMSWLYRGKYDYFEGKYLPKHEDYIQDSIYPCYWDYMYYSYYYMGANLDDYGICDARAIREFNSYRTDGGLYNTFFQHTHTICDEFPLYDAGLRAGLSEATNDEYRIKFITAPISWMKNNEQPVVVEGIHGHAHYWGAIGYAYNEGWLGAKLNMRLLVMDNGVYSCSDNDFYCYPYWSILGGLNYAWKLN